MVSFADDGFRSQVATGRIWIAIACLRGEFADKYTTSVVSHHVIDDAREGARQNPLCSMTRAEIAQGLR
jgi:hypothetical protein